jgi:hypothetical protein
MTKGKLSLSWKITGNADSALLHQPRALGQPFGAILASIIGKNRLYGSPTVQDRNF